MRPLDPIKQDQIIQAVFSLAGKVGLAGINITAISKEAKVGVGSLYTYFKSKEEVIQVAYSSVEHTLTQRMYAGFDITQPVQTSLRQIYMNTLNYRLKHYDETIFIDQYIRSPYVQLNFAKQVKEFEEQHKPLYDLIRKGQKEGVLVKMDSFTIISFINGSVRSCSNGIVQHLIPNTKAAIEGCFGLVWRGVSI